MGDPIGLRAARFCLARGRADREVARAAWNTGDGPTEIFHYAVRWLRENDVFLPGITMLTRLVARARDQATQRLFTTLAEIPNQA